MRRPSSLPELRELDSRRGSRIVGGKLGAGRGQASNEPVVGRKLGRSQDVSHGFTVQPGDTRILMRTLVQDASTSYRISADKLLDFADVLSRPPLR